MANPSRPKKKRRSRRELNDDEQPSNDNDETRALSDPTSADPSSGFEQANSFLGDGATTNPQASSSSGSQQLQQQYRQQMQQQQIANSIPAAFPFHLLSSMAVPMPAGVASVSNSESQPHGFVDGSEHGTAVPLSAHLATQPSAAGIVQSQDSSQLSASLLVGIQQLLQQLSSNLAQRGLDTQSDINAAGSASQPIPMWPPPSQPGVVGSSSHYGSLQQESSNAMQAVVAAMAHCPPFDPTAMHAAATSMAPQHPPIHPGSATGDLHRSHPEYTTIPCRARGMPPDHNSQVCRTHSAVPSHRRRWMKSSRCGQAAC
jgi:hypothetical protein